MFHADHSKSKDIDMHATGPTLVTINKTAIRKKKKPLMEKKRRERINACLDDLKNLLLHGYNTDVRQFSKLEKADILEMTVKYIQSVDCGNLASLNSTESVQARYTAGFNECTRAVVNYLAYNGVRDVLTANLAEHLRRRAPTLSHAAEIKVTNFSNQPQSAYTQQTCDALDMRTQTGHSSFGSTNLVTLPPSMTERVTRQDKSPLRVPPGFRGLLEPWTTPADVICNAVRAKSVAELVDNNNNSRDVNSYCQIKRETNENNVTEHDLYTSSTDEPDINNVKPANLVSTNFTMYPQTRICRDGGSTIDASSPPWRPW